MKKIVTTQKAQAIEVTPPAIICALDGCDNPVVGRRRTKFCTIKHRNLFLATGENGTPPTEYTEEIATKAIPEFIKWCREPYDIVNGKVMRPRRKPKVPPAPRLPTVQQFTVYLKHMSYTSRVLTRQTIDNWTNRHPVFGDAYEEMMNEQFNFLLHYGLTGVYHPGLSKLMLGANHNIIEKKEVNNNNRLIGYVKHIHNQADRLDREWKERHGKG